MPTAKVIRAEFLEKLEQVQPGLATREVAEQATCFAFKDGRVFTYNEDVACRTRTDLPAEFRGAVQSRPLLGILKKMTDKRLAVSNGNGRLVLEALRRKNEDGPVRRARITLQKDVSLPIDQVERPDKGDWKRLPDDFSDAIKIVSACVGKDASRFIFTCVHITPKWIEASDRHQVVRYNIRMKIDKPFLVLGKSVRNVADMAFTSFAETDKWLHFRKDKTTVMSVLRFNDPYKADVTAVLAERGKRTKLPSKLAQAAEAAKEFAMESDDKHVRVRLTRDLMTVMGVGVTGDYTDPLPINYKGPPLAFVIQPDLLAEIGKRHTEVEITEPDASGNSKMRVDGGKWVYVAGLEREPDSKENEHEAE